MSTYFDKKKLLDDNSDLYISEFDKTLPVADLGSIIEAKKDYKKASEQGDTAGMKAANDKANDIREKGGGYLGGTDGSQYIAVAKPYEIRTNTNYVSPYKKDKKRVLDLISEKGEFSYDPNEDPVFGIYKSLYTKLGDDAYDRALSEGALRMGGVVSTSAQSSAMQAKNRYNTMLMAKIPELYDSAYKKYESEYERLYKELDLYTKLDDSEYQKYRDIVSDWKDDRNYFYKKDDDMYNRIMNDYKFDSDMEYKLQKDNTENDRWQDEFDYKVSRDEIEDGQWQDEFDYNMSRDEIEDAQWQKEFNHTVSSDSADNANWQKEFEHDSKMDIMSEAIDLAKIIYGDTGFTVSTVKDIMAMLTE